MESDSQPASTPNPTGIKLADLVGTLIALLTLFLPPTVIAHFSKANVLSQPTLYSLPKN